MLKKSMADRKMLKGKVAIVTGGLGGIGEPKPLGILFWVIATIGAAELGVLGNIPFMRLVKPGERTEINCLCPLKRLY